MFCIAYFRPLLVFLITTVSTVACLPSQDKSALLNGVTLNPDSGLFSIGEVEIIKSNGNGKGKGEVLVILRDFSDPKILAAFLQSGPTEFGDESRIVPPTGKPSMAVLIASSDNAEKWQNAAQPPAGQQQGGVVLAGSSPSPASRMSAIPNPLHAFVAVQNECAKLNITCSVTTYHDVDDTTLAFETIEGTSLAKNENGEVFVYLRVSNFRDQPTVANAKFWDYRSRDFNQPLVDGRSPWL